MSFEMPTPSDALYRLWRLRRLIAVASIVPIIVMAAMQGWALALTGAMTTGLLSFAFLTVVVIGAHAVFFPQARSETLALSLVMAILVVAAPLAGNSILGWGVLLIVSAVLIMVLQGRILHWEMASPERPATFVSTVRTSADVDAARAAFALHPEQVNARFECGAADNDGIFPVTMKPTSHFDIADEFSGQPPLSDEEHAAAMEDMMANLPEELRAEMEGMDYDFDMEPGPSFWAVKLRDTPEEIETLILAQNDEGNLVEASRTIHRFQPLKSGCKVTEVERNPGYPIGSTLGMWLTDFQKDGMIMTRDALEDNGSCALRAATADTMLTLVGKAFMRRQMRAMGES